jgi:hypothetical protein
MDFGSALITVLLTIGIGLAVFLALRALVLWYWKVDIIVNNLEAIANASDRSAEDRRKQHRINYYIAVASKDNQQAYVSLMNIILDDVLKAGVKEDVRKQLYAKNKEKFEPVFDRIGYPFPEYELLF